MLENALTKMVIEVAVFAILIYIVLRFLRETRGSGVVRGLAFLLLAGVITFVVLIQTMDLDRLGLLFTNVVGSVVIALVIIFHPEIRRAIVHLGDSPIFGRFFQKESKIVQRVLRAVARMSKERIGALIAVERDASLQTLAESGITIDAELNSFLIESIFYPKSALHDGAIVVREDRIVAASCLLPLSQNPDVDKRLGTRHRAALGLSEETDALSIVVSEETGKISVAQSGKLSFDLTLEQLERHMDEALGIRQRSARRREKGRPRIRWTALFHDPVRKLAALGLGIGLWFYLDSQISDSFREPFSLRHVAAGEQPPQAIGLNQVFVTLPTDRVALRGFWNVTTGEEILAASVEIQGPKYQIEELKGEGLTLFVQLPNVKWEDTESVEFKASDLTGPRVLRDPSVTVSLDPPIVRVAVERVARRTIQLHHDKVELQVPGNDRLRDRVRTQTMEFEPSQVTIYGRAQSLQDLSLTERPFRAVLTARPDAREASAPITLASGLVERGLRLENACSLRVQLAPVLKEYTLPIPVLVDDRALPLEKQGLYEPDQEVMTVTIRAGGVLDSALVGLDNDPDRLEQFARDNLRLFVLIPAREESGDLTRVPRLIVVGQIADELSRAEYGLAENQTIAVLLKYKP